MLPILTSWTKFFKQRESYSCSFAGVACFQICFTCVSINKSSCPQGFRSLRAVTILVDNEEQLSRVPKFSCRESKCQQQRSVCISTLGQHRSSFYSNWKLLTLPEKIPIITLPGGLHEIDPQQFNCGYWSCQLNNDLVNWIRAPCLSKPI